MTTTPLEGRPESVAAAALPHLRSFLSKHPSTDPVTLHVADSDDTLTVPRQAADLLEQILALLANGHGVTVMPDDAELTTQQAADFLNVSRPYLIKLLDVEGIEYRRVGAHRRIQFESLRRFRDADDRKRGEAADELAALTQGLDLE